MRKVPLSTEKVKNNYIKLLMLVIKIIIIMTVLHQFLHIHYSHTLTTLKSECVIQSVRSYNLWAWIKIEFFQRGLAYLFLLVRVIWAYLKLISLLEVLDHTTNVNSDWRPLYQLLAQILREIRVFFPPQRPKAEISRFPCWPFWRIFLYPFLK